MSSYWAFAPADKAQYCAYPKGGRGFPAGWGQAKQVTRDEPTMTYTFKLARRLARLRAAAVVPAATLAILACASDQSTGPGSPADAPTRVSITPDSVSVGVNQAMQFQASLDSSTESTTLLSASKSGKGRGRGWRTVVDLAIAPDTLAVAEGMAASFSAAATLSDGSTSEPSVSWAATGGTIDASGKYTAGNVPGNYVIRATAANGVADTAAVIVTESLPNIATVSLSPTSVSLSVGGTKQFLTVGYTSTGATVAVSPKYAATGGTITADGVYQAGQTPGTFSVIATDTASHLADTSTVVVEAPPATLQAIVLSPATVSLTAGGTQQFIATGKMSDGSTSSVTVTWGASGGTISSAGSYTAGSVAGSYRVIATQSGGTLADTAAVTITAPAPTLEAVVVTPASVTLQSGATQQFAVNGRMSDGTTTTVNAAYRATGGTITSGGLFTAGPSAGAFQVIATQQGGTLADTAAVTIQAPSQSASCLRTVNASTLSGFTSALANALPGDCIFLAPGTYALTTALRVNRSGTATAPITIQGGGSNTVINLMQQEMTFEKASYVRLRKMRLTNFPLRGLWLRDSHYNVLDSLEIDHTLHEAVALKDLSSFNTIQNCAIHDTGLYEPWYAEGVYVGGSADAGYTLDGPVTDNQVLNSRFGPNVRSQAVDVKSGADRTVIRGNTIDGTGTEWHPEHGSGSLIDVGASGVIIEANVMRYGSPNAVKFFQPTNYVMTGTIARNNTVDLQNIHDATVAYYGFNLTVGTDNTSHVTIKCNNTVINGPFSNVACTP